MRDFFVVEGNMHVHRQINKTTGDTITIMIAETIIPITIEYRIL